MPLLKLDQVVIKDLGKKQYQETFSAMRDFVASHDFPVAFNYHSYSNLMIYPFGEAMGFWVGQIEVREIIVKKLVDQKIQEFEGFMVYRLI